MSLIHFHIIICMQVLLSWPWSYINHCSHWNCYGATVNGWKHLLFCHNFLWYISSKMLRTSLLIMCCLWACTVASMSCIGINYGYFRIFGWSYVIWTSFLAGVLQTLLYADFIYYFVKANKSQNVMSFNIWSYIIKHNHK